MPLISDGPGNRGSGQPINQPMGGNPNWPTPTNGGINPQGVPKLQPDGTYSTPPMGSLQSLGGGQLNQSGMVNLRGPDGSSKAVPQSDLAHWLSKGAVRV
jgi:hypothetical protein